MPGSGGTPPDPVHTQPGARGTAPPGFGVIWGLGEHKRRRGGIDLPEEMRNQEDKPRSEVKGWGKPLRAGERWIKGLAYRGSERSPTGDVPPSPGMRPNPRWEAAGWFWGPAPGALGS